MQHEKPHWFVTGYERFLRAAIRHRGVVLLLGFAFLILSVQLYARFGQGVELFPEVEPRNATVQVKFPQGTSIERTDEVLRTVEQKLAAYPDIEFSLTTIGGQNAMSFGGGGAAASHQGNDSSSLWRPRMRQTNSLAVIDSIRTAIGTVPGAEIKVEREEEGPPTGAPVSIELSGDDFELLEQFAVRHHPRHRDGAGTGRSGERSGKGAAGDPVPGGSDPRGAAGSRYGHDRPIPAHGHLRHGKQQVPGRRGRI